MQLTFFDYFTIVAAVIFFTLILYRVWLLNKNGIRAFVFGKTDKSDFLIPPVILLLAYSVLATFINIPFPAVLSKVLFSSVFVSCIGVLLCLAGIIWLFVALSFFGKSFRIGIDKSKAGKLITSGIFSISRNPIYMSFYFFGCGVVLMHPSISVAALFILFFIPVIHRQVLREEAFMKNFYGAEYLKYCKSVRRYI